MLSTTNPRNSPDYKQGIASYVSVAMVAGAIISLQIGVMRVFAVGSWAHFGSLVISLALLGFSLSSVIIFLFKEWIERHWSRVAALSLVLMGPLIVGANFAAQQLPFNAIFLISDPEQKWRLLANFLLYLLPFFSGAFFLGVIFLKSQGGFNRIYFADLTGSGIAGIVMLGAFYVFEPEKILSVALGLWAVGTVVWLIGRNASTGAILVAILAGISIAAYWFLPAMINIPSIAISPYKGISYARNFPDAKRIYRSISPFGDLQIYKSSYMHFAPGLSDNAAFNVPEVPHDIFGGMYLDGEGPEGFMRSLPMEDAAFYSYLPAHYPYVIKSHPKTFIVELGGGISAKVALEAGASSVTAAESNPAILSALRAPALKDATSDLLTATNLHIIDGNGRIYLGHTSERYDVIDLSLVDSVGLSNPGGFAVVEKYAYTEEAVRDYIRALANGGILSMTVWNKEEPPKSVLKFYATVAKAAGDVDPGKAAQSLFVASSYLSTATVLYKKGGFSAEEINKLRDYTNSMSFDEIYSPGLVVDLTGASKLLVDYHNSIFGNVAKAGDVAIPVDSSQSDTPPPNTGNADGDPAPLPSTILGRVAWQALLNGNWPDFIQKYAFDVSVISNERPYFAGYEKFSDLPKTLDRLDLFQDDWGYLVLWATLCVAALATLPLIGLPLLFGWHRVFSKSAGKAGTVAYFACLGLGYIMVEVGLMSRFTLALSNPTISASVIISAMLVFSGIGSLVSERLIEQARQHLPKILAAIAILLVAYAFVLPPMLNSIAGLSYGVRVAATFILIAPPATLMGFPMATGMGWLTKLGKEHMFVWAWGVNGCFSVIGAALTPIVATTFGLSAVLYASAAAYLLAAPAFLQLLRSDEPAV
jgi:spermidine synthase